MLPSADGSTAAGTDACPALNFPKSFDIDMVERHQWWHTLAVRIYRAGKSCLSPLNEHMNYLLSFFLFRSVQISFSCRRAVHRRSRKRWHLPFDLLSTLSRNPWILSSRLWTKPEANRFSRPWSTQKARPGQLVSSLVFNVPSSAHHCPKTASWRRSGVNRLLRRCNVRLVLASRVSGLIVIYSIQKQLTHLAARVMGTLVGGIVLGAFFFFGAAYAHWRWTTKKAKASNVSNVEKHASNPLNAPHAQPVITISFSASVASTMPSPSISISSVPAAPTTPYVISRLHPESDSLRRAFSTNSTRI
jgi:hypothetical protein